MTQLPTKDRPRDSCGCGYEIVWVAGGWEHDAAPSLWGNDHEIDTPEPETEARRHWDEEDGIEPEHDWEEVDCCADGCGLDINHDGHCREKPGGRRLCCD